MSNPWTFYPGNSANTPSYKILYDPFWQNAKDVNTPKAKRFLKDGVTRNVHQVVIFAGFDSCVASILIIKIKWHGVLIGET